MQKKIKVLDKYIVEITIPEEVHEVLTDDELEKLRDELAAVVMDIQEACLDYFERFRDIPGMKKLDVRVRATGL